MSSLKVQIARVTLLNDMVGEELVRCLDNYEEMEKWRKTEPRDWRAKPDDVPKSILKDRMKLLRQEMIRLDKML